MNRDNTFNRTSMWWSDERFLCSFMVILNLGMGTLLNRRGRTDKSACKHLRTSDIRHKFSCKPVCAGLQLKWLGLEDLLTHHVEGLAIAHDEDLTVTDDLGEVGLNFGIADSSRQLRLCCD